MLNLENELHNVQQRLKILNVECDIELDEKIIERISPCYFLGLIVDDKLTWKCHKLKVRLFLSYGMEHRTYARLLTQYYFKRRQISVCA